MQGCFRNSGRTSLTYRRALAHREVRGKTLLSLLCEGRKAAGRSTITPYVKDHKGLHQTRETLFRAGLMALCPKEEEKVVAEQPVSLQESRVLVTSTPESSSQLRGGSAPLSNPAPVLQRPPAHVAQMWAYTPWLQRLKDKRKASFPLQACSAE